MNNKNIFYLTTSPRDIKKATMRNKLIYEK